MKKIFYICVFLGLVTQISACGGISQQAKDAVLSLKKLEAKTQVGVSFDDYYKTLSESKLMVNIYLEGGDAKGEKELADLIKGVMGEYEFAGAIWRVENQTNDEFPAHAIALEDNRAAVIVEKFPGLGREMNPELMRKKNQQLLAEANPENNMQNDRNELAVGKNDGAVFKMHYTPSEPGVSHDFAKKMSKIQIMIDNLGSQGASDSSDLHKFLDLDVAKKVVWIRAEEDLDKVSKIALKESK